MVLTRNEVQIQRDAYPNNALVVVSNIKLARGDVPVATGGTEAVTSPWLIEEDALTAIGFVYEVP